MDKEEMMDISRRAFFGTMFTAAGSVAFSKDLGGMRPNLKVGILSDTHVTHEESKNKFRQALEFFKKEKVDAVLIAGDISDHGFMWELKMVSDAWYSVFPNDKYEDGSAIVKLFVTGNHDDHAWTWVNNKEQLEKNRKEAFVQNKQENWKNLFHEEWRPIYIKTVKGYPFIGAHWGEWWNGKLEKFIAEHKKELPPSKPFFYNQHPHLKDTIFGPWAWGACDDHGEGRKALNPFPNAFSFSGHSHFPLTDERDIWQGEFTAVGTSSLRFVDFPYGRENATLSYGNEESQMQRHPGIGYGIHAAQQGMIMKVWDHSIVLERYDFRRFEKLDEDWVVPIIHSVKDPRPFSFENRAKLTQAPEFHKDAKIAFEYRDGKNRKGTPAKQIVLTFPAAESVNWEKRVYEYEVSAEIVDCDTVKPYATKRVFQPGIETGPKYTAKTAECIFALSELPKAKELLRFAVTPMNCYGKRGKTLYAAYQPPKQAPKK